ncbi:MAG: hypothetical protein B7Z61_06540 [Acidobacteria bacterium 37-71-11]|nr:MAG: hypothetical protein B7Z61_06540 [Acidobacteria bacterium 37-71-11]
MALGFSNGGKASAELEDAAQVRTLSRRYEARMIRVSNLAQSIQHRPDPLLRLGTHTGQL